MKFNYALFTHHFESIDLLNDSVDLGIPPEVIFTLPEDLNHKWLGYEIFNIRQFAKDQNILLIENEDFNNKNILKNLQTLNIDLLVILGCSQIISNEIMSKVKYGAIGTHASLLPELRGSAPINWALIKDLEYTGNTLMKLSNDLDAGAILDQEKFDINDSDDCKSLYFKVSKTNSKMIIKNINFLIKHKKYPPCKVQKILNSLSPRRRPEDSKLDWKNKARVIFNFIRALSYPYPNAFSYLNNEIIKFNKVSYLIKDIDFQPGYIVGQYFPNDSNKETIGSIAALDGLILFNELSVDGVLLNGLNLKKWLNINKSKILI